MQFLLGLPAAVLLCTRVVFLLSGSMVELSVASFLMAWLLYSYVLHLIKGVVECQLSSYLCSILSAGRPPKWVLQKGAAESHVDPDPQGAAESRVESDLSGQGTAESRRGVAPAPVPTDESNGDPVEVPACQPVF